MCIYFSISLKEDHQKIISANSSKFFFNFTDDQLLDVFAVVTYEDRTGTWRLWVFSEETVPAFGPSIPYPNSFTDQAEFREFLITKRE